MAKGRSMMPGNMQGMMKQVQKMQQEMQKMQKEIEETVFEGTSGGGAVRAKVNGKKYVEEIIINPEILDPEDAEMVSDMIVAAVNDAIKQAEETSNSKLGALTGGLNIPGL